METATATEVTAPVETAQAESAAGGNDFFNSIEAAFNAAGVEDPAPAEPTLPVDDNPGNEEPAAGGGENQPEPESTTTSETEIETETLAGKAGRRFKQLKSELKSVSTELATLREQLQQRESLLQELQASNTEQDTYKQQLAEYEQALAVAKLESHPTYKREVEGPMTELVQSAESIAERYGIDVDELVDVLGYNDRDKQDETLDRILQGVKERDKLAVYALAEQVPLIAARRDELQANAQAALAELAELENQQNQQTLAQRLEERRAAAKDVQRKLVEKVPFLTGLENLNLDQLSGTAANTDFDVLSAHHKVYAKMAGDMLPTLAREYVALRSELEDALDELESYKKTEPGTGAGPAATSSTSANTKSGGFLDAINAALAGR